MMSAHPNRSSSSDSRALYDWVACMYDGSWSAFLMNRLFTYRGLLGRVFEVRLDTEDISSAAGSTRKWLWL